MRRFLIAAAWALGAAGSTHAASISGVSPQGEAAQVRQVTVRFSEAVVPFGELRLPDPMTVLCQGGQGGPGAAPSGAGRWASDRIWLYDFKDALPPGTRCTLKARADWKPSAGTLTGRIEFAFSTGGPAVVSTQPYDGNTIDEDQHFLLRLSGPAVDATVAANVWCEVQGIGERLPVRIVTGRERDDLLKARRVDKQAAKAPAQWQVLSCQRPLPAEAGVRLVWGKGIAALANPRIVTSVDQVYKYKVRKAFTAEFSCERERAGAPCWPVLAEMLWAAFKSLFTVTAILGVMLVLGISHSPKLLVAWPILLGVGITFSCIALIFNALAKGYDFFTYYFTLFLTPMMFLSGVFFPLDQLPSAVRVVADWLPLSNAVALVRPLFMDQWPTDAWRHGLVLLAYASGAFWVALAFTRKRFSK